ncbi:hypothetical protein R6Z07F_019530 [Ovis aries]
MHVVVQPAPLPPRLVLLQRYPDPRLLSIPPRFHLLLPCVCLPASPPTSDPLLTSAAAESQDSLTLTVRCSSHLCISPSCSSGSIIYGKRIRKAFHGSNALGFEIATRSVCPFRLQVVTDFWCGSSWRVNKA